MLKKIIIAVIFLAAFIACARASYAGQSADSEANKMFFYYQKLHKKIEKRIKKGFVAIPEKDMSPSSTVIPGEKYVYKHKMLSSPVQAKRETVYFSSLVDKSARYVQTFMPGISIQKGQILTDQWIYIFMSSSVPISVWHAYTYAINKMKQGHIVIVMRGCIGGCVGNNMAKTILWVKHMLHFRGVRLYSPVEIDPYLFEYYHIHRVPDTVYAENVHLFNPSVTAGFAGNLKTPPKWFSVKGDYGLNYILKRLYAKSHSVRLVALRRLLNRSFFSY